MSDIHALREVQAMRLSDRSITIILNPRSGVNEKELICQQITDTLGEIHKVITLMPSDDFYDICEQAVLEAQRTDGVVVVAGGDGTVNLVAGLCCKHGVIMSIIPLGTFNYFAHEFEPTK